MNKATEVGNIILVTGKPGSGKTTLVSRVFQLLSNHDRISITGFVTEELRIQDSNGYSTRIGFDVVRLSGGAAKPQLDRSDRAPLARVTSHASHLPRNAPRVGSYLVDLTSFERLALPYLESCFLSLDEKNSHDPAGTLRICVIDEIGKMELLSSTFRRQIERLIQHISQPSVMPNTVLLATVPLGRGPSGQRGIRLVDDLCSLANARLFEISLPTRDKMTELVYTAVTSLL